MNEISDLDKRIAEANDEFISDWNGAEESVLPAPIDLYQERQRIQREYSKKTFARGARAQVLATVQDVVNGAGRRSLATAYKKANDECESLVSSGDTLRAQMVANTYMTTAFLPAVEVVVNFTSPDELLECPEALDTLDKYVLTGGKRGGKGFTEGYVREAYAGALGQVEALSSPEVTNAVDRINGYLNTGQMNVANGLASKIRDKIKAGKVFASESDYHFILMVADGMRK